MSDISRIFESAEAGDPSVADRLLPLIYAELRQLAAAKMKQERPGHTLAPTALVHEAYVRLMGSQSAEPWQGRGHFFSAAAEAMRRVLIDYARKHNAAKRGGELERIEWDPEIQVDLSRGEELTALDESLDQLEQVEPQAAAVIKLRFFAGLTNRQAAEELGISPRKADVLWSYARAWLRRAMSDDEPERPEGDAIQTNSTANER